MGSGLSFFAGAQLLSRKGLYEGETSSAAAIAELYRAADLGEEGIVLADADIQAGLDRCSALPHDDCATGNDLAAEGLHAQPLGI